MSETKPAILGEIRVSNTADLLHLYVTAKKLGLNRNVPDDVVANLDPAGNHVFTLALLDHRADPARGLPTHHRVSALLKLRDSRRPYCMWLDVTATSWTQLVTMDEARTLNEAGGRFDVPTRLANDVVSAVETTAQMIRVEVVS